MHMCIIEGKKEVVLTMFAGHVVHPTEGALETISLTPSPPLLYFFSPLLLLKTPPAWVRIEPAVTNSLHKCAATYSASDTPPPMLVRIILS